MKSIVSILTVLLLATAVSGADLSADGAKSVAGILSNLDGQVTWPEGKSLEGNGELLVITAIGESSLFDALKEFNGKQTKEGRTIKFRLVEPDWMPANSHVLIFNGIDSERTKKLINLLIDRGSLTVTLGEGNSALGSAINFVEAGAEVQTEVNLKVTKREGFALKASFLETATVVEE
jgi:hypothetical protein